MNRQKLISYEEQYNEQRKTRLRPLARLMGMTLRYWGKLIMASIALIIAAVLVLSIGEVIKQLVDGSLLSGTHTIVDIFIITFVFMAIIGISSSLRLYFVGWIGERVVANLRKRVYDHIIQQSPSFFELNHSGAILSRLTTDSGIIQTLIGTTSSVAIRHSLIFLAAISFMFYIDGYLALVTTVVAPTTILILYAVGRKVRQLSRKSQDRIADMSAYAEESLRGIKILQAYSHQDINKKQFDSHVETTFKTAVSRLKMRALMIALVMIGVFILVSTLLYVGMQEVKNDNITLGELSQFLFSALLAGGSIAALTESFGEILRATGAAERMFEILDSRIDITSPQNPIPIPQNSPAKAPLIAIKNVSFQYPLGKEQKAIDAISLNIIEGEKIAIVGPSGAGKSTLFQLLLRFYDPQQGQIMLWQHDIRNYDVDDVRKQFAFVSQDPIIFAASARDNITYAKPEATEQELVTATKNAALFDTIQEFPQQFDSYLGQGGILLSGGERQRIALARAFLKKPKILLLDEATSALDATSEKHIQKAVDKIAHQCTTLIIAHRLSTVIHAPRLIVLAKGRIIAEGKHQTLLDTCPLYARLTETQLQQNV